VKYYRTPFEVTGPMLGKGSLFVCFDGVDYEAHVFVNKHFVGSHEGFFAPFEFDISDYVRDGENILVVKVVNDAICRGNDSWREGGGKLEGDKIYAATGPGYDDPQLGWHHCPPGMGIYQNVRIEARSELFVHDIFVRPVFEEGQAEVWLELWNNDAYRKNAQLQLSILGQNFDSVVCEDKDFELIKPMGPGVNYYRFTVDMGEFRTWEPETPWLYQVQARLLSEDGECLDTASEQFGMRSFTMDTESEPKGRMYLNGREIRLRGANTMGFEQQDVMREDWQQLIDDILLAKVCNMNFWRLTQRPVQKEVYDYCDRLGLMTQTDLPLFGVLRRNQFCEAVRQAEEMERLVRSHPCNIMDTYINEPFPNGWEEMHRQLLRHEMERFFTAANQAVYQANPDRVIKPVDGDYDPPAPGLPDNHCYCGWYNGHGLQIGKLHRGYWQPVKKGWMYGCGEFGSEGLENAELMRNRYPKDWLPQSREEERKWSPSSIVRAQTGKFHYMWFDTQHSLEDWVEESQKHQAWVTRIMTEAFRRDSRMNSFAIHLFIDAFPSGWMKTIMDVERRPKKAFFVYKDVLNPLIASLRTDRTTCFEGETANVEAWICNDTHDRHKGARIAYRLEKGDKILQGGWADADVPLCDSKSQGMLKFQLPQVTMRSELTVRLAILDAEGDVLHDTALELDVLPCSTIPNPEANLVVTGERGGKADRLARATGFSPEYSFPAELSHNRAAETTVLIDDFQAYREAEDKISEWVRQGATAVFLELPDGEYKIAGSTVNVEKCGMGARNFVSRDTGHRLVQGFRPDDFKFWYDASVGYVTPLLETTFCAEEWEPILASGNGSWESGEWKPTLAAAERADGEGEWRVCNVKLAGRIQGNPVARIFATRLLQAL
jgi:hypothetical protein